MFDNFSQRINKIFDQISGKKFISEDDLNTVLREIRIALLEADVSLLIAKNFIEEIKQEAIGKQVLKTVSASQMIIKIVHDHLVKLLGSNNVEINFNSPSPIIILMVGLQGSGKTTSSGKLALRLKNKNHKKILLASLDTYRPAAATQLKILSEKIGVDFDEFDASKSPVELAIKAKERAVSRGYDVLIVDTAGRVTIDEKMMTELVKINQSISSNEILLVVDSMMGQDAINVAKKFNEILNLTGIVLTRLDGDARGGVALTMRYATNCHIKLIGVGEKLEELEEFHPDRIASRIVGMGDVVSLVEKAQEVFDAKEMEKEAKKIKSGKVDFNLILSQIRNMKKIGGISNIINLLPGAGKLKEQMGKMTGIEKEIKLQEAIILSMTKKERDNPHILNSSRKHRIAKGAGTNIQEVNRLIKRYKQLQKMMDKFGKIDPKKMQEIMENKNIF